MGKTIEPIKKVRYNKPIVITGIIRAPIIAGVLIMILVYLIPVMRLCKHVEVDRSLFDTEQDYPMLIWGYEFTILDCFTDSQMLSEAVYYEDEGLIYRAMINPSPNYPDALSMHEQVYRYLDDDDSFEEYPRGRYWHGYLVVLKPLLYWFTYREIRILNYILQFFLTGCLSFLLVKKTGAGSAAAFVGTYIFLFPASVAFCMEFSIMYYVSTVSSIALIKDCFRRDDQYLLFLLTGISAAFFDYLTYPLLTLAMPLVVWVLCCEKADHKMLFTEIFYSICWLLGYVGMWGGKWIIATLITGVDVIKEGWDTVLFRSLGEIEGFRPDYLHVLKKQTDIIFHSPMILLLIMLIMAFVYLSVIKRERWNSVRSIGIISVACLPFLWYAVLRNHSYVHAWFTYRTLSVLVFASGCLVLCPDSLLKQDSMKNNI